MPPMIKEATWKQPDEICKSEMIAISDAVLSEPDIPMREYEDIFRIHSSGMEWDIGNVVYAPDEECVPRGRDGRKIGIFMTHGGASDWRSIERLARGFAKKRGVKVCSMTYPGRFYFPHASRDWPGDTFRSDGTVRTPIWRIGEEITPNQYEIVADDNHRDVYGTRSYAAAKPGTVFFERMAAFPKAFVDAMINVCDRHFPRDEWTVYVHGHSTGGPFVHALLQRVENVNGVIGIENSSFGQFFHEMTGRDWPTPFNYLLVRSWRELARYKGAELALAEGEKPLFRLARVMEEIFAAWDDVKRYPQFKAENWFHNRTPACLAQAAQVSAKRQGLSEVQTRALVEEYLSYGVPLSATASRRFHRFFMASMRSVEIIRLSTTNFSLGSLLKSNLRLSSTLFGSAQGLTPTGVVKMAYQKAYVLSSSKSGLMRLWEATMMLSIVRSVRLGIWTRDTSSIFKGGAMYGADERAIAGARVRRVCTTRTARHSRPSGGRNCLRTSRSFIACCE